MAISLVGTVGPKEDQDCNVVDITVHSIRVESSISFRENKSALCLIAISLLVMSCASFLHSIPRGACVRCATLIAHDLFPTLPQSNKPKPVD